MKLKKNKKECAMHEAKDSRLQRKNELALTSAQLNHLCNSASNQWRTAPIIFFFLKAVFFFFAPSSLFSI